MDITIRLNEDEVAKHTLNAFNWSVRQQRAGSEWKVFILQVDMIA